MNNFKPQVLLVEDNPGDVILFNEAVKEAKADFNVKMLTDGAEAIEYLFKRGQYKNAPTPDFIILDLNLPKKSGQEVVKEMKKDEKLFGIPLVILTSESHEQDVLEGYNPNRCLYLMKPTSFAEIVEVVKKIQRFFLSVNKEQDKM